MKNTLAIAMLAAAAAPMAAHAESTYVGAGVGAAEQVLSIKTGTYKDTAAGVKLFTGFNFDKHFGVEAGFTHFGKAETGGKLSGSRARSFYAAGTVTLPLGEKWALTGKLGIAKNRTMQLVVGDGDDKQKKTDALLGVGATFAVTKTIAAFVEYENYGTVAKGNNGSLKATVLSTGMRFSF
ncbi:outer membrane beta-barrel protein [Massilia sp. DJPM01]|uniref:outer membrane beta-barrel protein n=1 Tax=Massilia sp. DJPM01 TaxID=3024404 RepID=UPI00259D57C6|nr:outer membrane beta-barrel protein [Massilia sp. DJPM01]